MNHPITGKYTCAPTSTLKSPSMPSELPFKISALAFIRNTKGEHLLIQRTKAPNKNCWSPIGGKLDMHTGESPYECARREVMEEISLPLNDDDIHCFGYISEKSYEGTGHWLMFLFDCTKRIHEVPPTIDEGNFAFFSREAIDQLKIPETDRTLLWPYYDRFANGFVGLRANCDPAGKLTLTEELTLNPRA